MHIDRPNANQNLFRKVLSKQRVSYQSRNCHKYYRLLYRNHINYINFPHNTPKTQKIINKQSIEGKKPVANCRKFQWYTKLACIHCIAIWVIIFNEVTSFHFISEKYCHEYCRLILLFSQTEWRNKKNLFVSSSTEKR